MRKDRSIHIKPNDWLKMMFCVKHLMKLHPELNEMIMPFYSKMYDIHPFDESHFDDTPELDVDPILNLGVKPDKDSEPIDMSLDEMMWNLGIDLPSWNSDGENNEKESPSST